MQLPTDIADRLRTLDQPSIVQAWHSLDDQGQQRLLQQMRSIEWSLVSECLSLSKPGDPVPQAASLSWLHQARSPQALLMGSSSNHVLPCDALRTGRHALSRGAIGAILLAGGQGTRLRAHGPKGCYPIGPVSKASLYEILCGKLLAVARRYGRDVPLAVMTSCATDDDTRQYFENHSFFGLNSHNVFFFCQQEVPVLHATDKQFMLESPDHIAMAPDGHGGMLTSLAHRGGLDWFVSKGVEQLVSFQVDNPLIEPLSAEFLGYHLLSKAEMTTQVVRKENPRERVGVIVERDRTFQIVEYSDLPHSIADERLSNGCLRFSCGSIAVHCFDISFMIRMSHNRSALPFHVVHKAVPLLLSNGTIQVPENPNALKFERFIFDLLPQAERVSVVEVDRNNCFAPLKNPLGSQSDGPEHVQRSMLAKARAMMESAGVHVDDGIPIEIDCAHILDVDDIPHFIAPGTRMTAPTVVGRSIPKSITVSETFHKTQGN